MEKYPWEKRIQKQCGGWCLVYGSEKYEPTFGFAVPFTNIQPTCLCCAFVKPPYPLFLLLIETSVSPPVSYICGFQTPSIPPLQLAVQDLYKVDISS